MPLSAASLTPFFCCVSGVREVVLCKDAKGKCGLSFFPVNKGVFVCFVAKASPAAMAGVRFGDQVLTVSLRREAGRARCVVCKVW